MFTPQQLQEKKFEKARFGGYEMSQIDAFLDDLFNDYTALYKENATLKAKMKVLAEKIEEYRAVDEEMRKALYSAQVSAKDTVEKAQYEAERIVSQAEDIAEEKIKNIKTDIETEQKRLLALQEASAKYAQGVKSILNKGIVDIDAILYQSGEEVGGAAQKKAQPKAFEVTFPDDVKEEPTDLERPEPKTDARPIQKKLEPDEDTDLTENLKREPALAGAGAQDKAEPQGKRTAAAGKDIEKDDSPLDERISMRENGPSNGNMETKFFEIDLGEKFDQKDETQDLSDTAKIYGETVFTPKPKFNFTDLKFGKNYSEDEDDKK